MRWKKFCVNCDIVCISLTIRDGRLEGYSQVRDEAEKVSVGCDIVTTRDMWGDGL